MDDRTGPVRDVITPVPAPVWREVLASDPDATAQQTPEYAAAIRRASRTADASRLYRLEDGRRLLLPLVGRSVLPGVRFEADFPTGYGHGGLLAEGGLQPGDVAAVVAELRSRRGLPRALSTRVDGHHHTSGNWEIDVPAGVVETRRRVDVVDLSQGFEEVWRMRFSKTVRRNVARAEREGVRIECDTTGRLVPQFYEVYLAWVEERLPRSVLPPGVARRLARRRESLEKFQAVAGLLGANCRVWVANHRGRPVACSMTLLHGRHAVGWRGYSIKDLAAPVAANTALSVAEIRDAAQAGCVAYDLGQSSELPGLLMFKHSLGARPREVIDLRVEPRPLTRLRAFTDRSRRMAERLLAERSPGSITRK